MSRNEPKLTFAVCAYKENPFLEDCIRSLEKQSVPVKILVATSTPNEHIRAICERHGLPLYIRKEQSAIAPDWNFAYDRADTRFVTIAHQDDLYEPDYAEKVLAAGEKRDDVLIVHTDYYEQRPEGRVDGNRLLKIKRMMNAPMRPEFTWGWRWLRRRILALGNPICCPSVCLVKDNLGPSVFDEKYRNSCDFKTWAVLSKKKGAFCYVPEKLMGHRIYPESTTTENIRDNTRYNEDLEIFGTFWPKPIARLLMKVYAKGMDSNG